MRHKLLIGLCLSFLLFGALTEAISPPPMPQMIRGTVTIDDRPAPVGTNITIKAGEKTIASTTVEKSGEYSVGFGYGGSENVTVFVNGVETGEINYEPGDIVEANLTAKSYFSFLPVSIAIVAGLALLFIKARKR